MRQMKDSGIQWIETIPDSWKLTRLRYLISNYKAGPFGSSLITEELDDDGTILVFTPEHVATQRTDLESNQYLPIRRKIEMMQFLVQEDDIVFPIVGSLGRAMRITNSMPKGIINQRLAKFRITSDLIDIEFFIWLFARSQFYLPFIELQSRGSIIQNLTKAIIYDMPVLLPPFNEQRRIADFLDKKCTEIDSLTADVQKEIETLQEYRRSLITEAVTKGLDPSVEMKESGIPWIGMIPTYWAISKIKYNLHREEPRNPGGVPVLSLYREYGVVLKDSRDDNHNVTSEDTSKYKYVRVGDFVINKMKAWQGSVAVSGYEGIVSPAYFIYRFDNKNIYRGYFHYLIRGCYKEEFRRLSGGIREGQWDLPSEAFDNTLMPLPPIDEQHRIADFLDEKCAEINSLIEVKQKQLDTLVEYRRSLIYEYVTGKKEVV